MEDTVKRNEKIHLDENKGDVDPDSEDDYVEHNRNYWVLIQDLTDNKNEELQVARDNMRAFNT